MFQLQKQNKFKIFHTQNNNKNKKNYYIKNKLILIINILWH